METTFLQWLVGQTGLAGLAGLALWMLKNSYEQRLADEQAHREEITLMYQETRQALEGNTRVLTEAIEHLREAVRCPILLNSDEYRRLAKFITESAEKRDG